jgi:hypothetical protein
MNENIKKMFLENLKMGDCFKHYSTAANECGQCMVSKECKKSTEIGATATSTNVEEAVEVASTKKKDRAENKEYTSGEVIDILRETFTHKGEITSKSGTSVKHEFDCNGTKLEVIVSKDNTKSANIIYQIDGGEKTNLPKVTQNDFNTMIELCNG